MSDEKLQGSGCFCLRGKTTCLPLLVGMETRWLANKQTFIITAITPQLCTVQPKFYNEVAYAFVLSPNQYHACFCIFLTIAETSVSISVLDELLRCRLKSGALKVNASGNVKPAYVVNTNMMWGLDESLRFESSLSVRSCYWFTAGGGEKSQAGREAETISSVQMKVLIDGANERRVLLTLYNLRTVTVRPSENSTKVFWRKL